MKVSENMRQSSFTESEAKQGEEIKLLVKISLSIILL